MLRRCRRLVAVGAALILVAGCRTPAPPGPPKFSNYKPVFPYGPLKDGVAERSVSTLPGPGYDVAVRDFLVSPRNPEAALTLAGAAVFEVRQGSGEATIKRAKETEKIVLSQGTVFTVNAGESLNVTAIGEPLALRACIFSPGGKP
ncbi:MAG TPA: hypothetical protein VJ725_24460 [Thermoanaerobaculia bacterium]|nr:hypothetical protein [Thermoanaerobaculia bacterium]